MTRLAMVNICRRWQGRVTIDELFDVARSLHGRFTVELFRDELRAIGETRPRLTLREIRRRALARAAKAARSLGVCPACGGDYPCAECAAFFQPPPEPPLPAT